MIKTHIATTTSSPTEQVKLFDCALLLAQQDVSYTEKEPYLQVGSDPATGTLVVYVSIIPPQLEQSLLQLLPFLTTSALSFYLIKSDTADRQLLLGSYGKQHIGKSICIYLPPEQNWQTIIDELVILTTDLKGPPVPDAFLTGGTVYSPFYQEVIKNRYYHATPEQEITLPRKYKVASLLKENPKGNVYKGVYYTGFFPRGFCIIKEGKKNMWDDNDGRDIKDRLEWQRQLHTLLKGKVNIPRLLDYLDIGGNVYLILKFVPGKSIGVIISDTYKGRCWQQLASKEQQQLLLLLLQVLKTVHTLHDNQIVHRDLTPINFILTPADDLYLIDLELSYQLDINYPSPAFTQGSPGYMSPEQQAVQRPTMKEDIYALGALMIYFFLNLQAAKFDTTDIDALERHLYYFIGNNAITRLIAHALHSDPTQRPSIEELQQVVGAFQQELKQRPSTTADINIDNHITVAALDKAIATGIRSLMQPASVTLTALLKIIENNPSSASRQGLGLLNSITGILWLLNKHTNWFPKELKELYQNRFDSIPSDYFLVNDATPFPLLLGSSGIAFTLYAAQQNGFIDTQEPKWSAILENCFTRDATTPGLLRGIAGQGLVNLLLLQNNDSPATRKRLQHYAELLLLSQTSDGSWPVFYEGQKKQSYNLSLAGGITGILYFLVLYYHFTQKESIRENIIKGLHWLEQQSKHQSGHYSWPLHFEPSQQKDCTLATGAGGIVLLFLKAYECLGQEKYKIIAEGGLRVFDANPVWGSYSLYNGLAGLGILYCEASTICNNPFWLQRAEWIAGLFIHTISHSDKGWNIVNANDYNVGLLTGNAGILYFLIEYRQRTIFQTVFPTKR